MDSKYGTGIAATGSRVLQPLLPEACVRGLPSLFADALARCAQGFDSHQLARPNFNFVPALRRSNPGCNITILTDQATQFAGLPPGVQVPRWLGLRSADRTP